jgi:hypothetical protein
LSQAGLVDWDDVGTEFADSPLERDGFELSVPAAPQALYDEHTTVA